MLDPCPLHLLRYAAIEIGIVNICLTNGKHFLTDRELINYRPLHLSCEITRGDLLKYPGGQRKKLGTNLKQQSTTSEYIASVIWSEDFLHLFQLRPQCYSTHQHIIPVSLSESSIRACEANLFTALIQRMGEGNTFSLFTLAGRGVPRPRFLGGGGATPS